MDTLILANAVLFLSTLSLRRATSRTKSNRRPLRFLSTLSLRRATTFGPTRMASGAYFYPRSPCGERQPGEHHANSQQEFLSTLSLRRATRTATNRRPIFFISIHALLAESDERADSFAHAPPQISIHALLAESDAP